MKINKSKTYLTYYFNKKIPIKFHQNLINTYIAFNNEYYCWCMLYKFSGKIEFTKYEQELEKSEFHIKTVDVDKEHVLYVFSIPKELDDVITLFTLGKYSYLPDINNLINYLVKNFNLPLNHNIVKILRRDNSLKKKLEDDLNIEIPEGLDLTDLPNLDNENYIFKVQNAKKTK